MDTLMSLMSVVLLILFPFENQALHHIRKDLFVFSFPRKVTFSCRIPPNFEKENVVISPHGKSVGRFPRSIISLSLSS
jgi:hypothetical protein